MKKRWSSALLAGALSLTLMATPAQALWSFQDEGVSFVDSGLWSEENGFYVARCPTTILYSYGLVNGTGPRNDGTDSVATGIELPLTRQEAVTLLIRMLGLEEEATAGQWSTPFTDVAGWAAPYVGCAYAKGMAAGTSATTFSGEAPITMEQFLTLMLRALGYSDTQGDFSWQDPYALADQVGLLCPLFSGEGFLRGDAMFICYEALDAYPKGSEQTLLESLEARGAIHSRGIPMLSDTCLKADPDTLPQQLDYLRDSFGITSVSIDFSDYPSLTAFTDQLWDYCQQRGYHAPLPENITYLVTRREEWNTDPAWKQRYLDAREGLNQIDQPFQDQFPNRNMANHAWYQAQADYLADKLPRETWSLNVSLRPTYEEYDNSGLLGAEVRLYEEKGILHGFPSLKYGLNVSSLSGEGQEAAYVLQAMDELWALYNQLVDEDMTDYQKVKAIYDGVIARTDYNYSIYYKYQDLYAHPSDTEASLEANNDPSYLLAHSWLGVVKGSDVVCEGYSEAMRLLLDLADIPNVVVTGHSENSGHAWNKVQLDGKWYNLDATWGDGGNAAKYFLRSDQAFSQDGHQDYKPSEVEPNYNVILPALEDYR